ncbi:MAG: dephospho-CoA kinase, partial [Bacteroidaceae bacterium]|nr:dephospho-CoA kinase [Bacteroidaceae bacterium]
MIIGVTGGIGAGKSYVCARLHARYGFPVYDCDRHAKELMTESTTLRWQLEVLVGQRLFDERGIIRERLSAFLFASDEHARQVAAIVHPVVRDDFLRWAGEQRGRHVLLESAILYESGFHTLADAVLFVDAPLEVRVRRAMERDRTSREQVE